jgi:hypothetical protein
MSKLIGWDDLAVWLRQQFDEDDRIAREVTGGARDPLRLVARDVVPGS